MVSWLLLKVFDFLVDIFQLEKNGLNDLIDICWRCCSLSFMTILT